LQGKLTDLLLISPHLLAWHHNLSCQLERSENTWICAARATLQWVRIAAVQKRDPKGSQFSALKEIPHISLHLLSPWWPVGSHPDQVLGFIPARVCCSDFLALDFALDSKMQYRVSKGGSC